MFNACSIEVLKTKFWQRRHFTKNFEDINEENIKHIEKQAKIFREKAIETINQKDSICYAKTRLYAETLNYLVNPSISRDLPTFDERLVFLFYAIDPDFKISELFISAPYPTNFELSNADDETSKQLKNKKQIIDSVVNGQISSEYGFSDPYFNYFERRFYAKRKLPTKLQKNITSNYVDELLTYCKAVRHFTNATPEDYEHAIELAQNYLSQFDETPTPNTVAYNLLKQNSLIGGDSTLKQIAMLFVLLIDPKFNMLKIYYDECMYQKMEERSLEELGFYNPELIRLEVEHHRKFTPEKIISEWQK